MRNSKSTLDQFAKNLTKTQIIESTTMKNLKGGANSTVNLSDPPPWGN